ncbi:hypothetical protein GGI42DRAFT_218473 [Trichoderma sp. SZMC 28013]
MGSSHFVPAIIFFPSVIFQKVVSSRGFPLIAPFARVIFSFYAREKRKVWNAFILLFIPFFSLFLFLFKTSAACWDTTWEHLEQVISLFLSLSLSVSHPFILVFVCSHMMMITNFYCLARSEEMSVASPYCVKEGLDNLRRAFAAWRGVVFPS